jgi:holo-[acyl-carrier-protein] synthase
MIFGIGTDVVEVSRIHESIEKFGDTFARRILSDSEFESYLKSSTQSRFLAKRFAAKEAFAKALGTGFRSPVRFQNIIVGHDDLGKPILEFDKELQDYLKQKNILSQHISISDEKNIATAFIGGVGSWAAEALARSAVGHLTLIDLDHIAESNINRQIHALSQTLGKSKVLAMKERILEINPMCQVDTVDDFISNENLEALIKQHFNVVIDAIDQASIKTSLALHALKEKIPLVMTGGAGGRIDPSFIKIADLSLTHGDRLTAKIRHDVKKALQLKESQKVGIDVVFTDEVMIKPEEACDTDEALTGLHCGGYGSSVMVTATFGFMAASLALKKLL